MAVEVRKTWNRMMIACRRAVKLPPLRRAALESLRDEPRQIARLRRVHSCKWWQIEPDAPVENPTVGYCIEEKLQSYGAWHDVVGFGGARQPRSTQVDEFDSVLALNGCERLKRSTYRLLQPFPKHRDESPPCYQAEPLGAFLAVPEFHAPVFLVRWVLPQSAETMGHVAMQVRYGFDQFGQKW
jgi:hypothetical protein